MKKNMISKVASAVLVASSLVLVGCGSSSNNNQTTGTGHYLDSAVAGVNYICGSQKGITDETGAFTFEKGKDCVFEVAGVTLKNVPADNLIDKVNVVEESNVTAAFLQSLDNDGDPTNGIQITPKVIEVLTKALQEAQITTVPKGTELGTVVSELDQKDSDYNGHKVTEEQAQQHLDKTQTSVLKNLIVGKTYYIAVNDADPVHVETLQFKDDGNTMLDTWPKQGKEVTSTFSYSITNGVLHISGTGGDGDNIDSDVFKGPITQTNTYIKDVNGGLLYKTKQAAEDALNNNSNTTDSYYALQTSDISSHTIKVGDPSKDKKFNTDGTFTSLESNPDTGKWSITQDGKLKVIWDSNDNVEIYHFAEKPAVGVMLTNETYSQSAKITEYI
ncbi:Autotransporter adhesin [hydrothermal vent metagenome]|uniref:Autotransporter adhesin n=1 Tax=hydrothermal vent metagenome TaxID=652676 RepID=A0A1W1CYS9_9ZZZZ